MEITQEKLDNYTFLSRLIKKLEERYDIHATVSNYKAHDLEGLGANLSAHGELRFSEMIDENGGHSIMFRLGVSKYCTKSNHQITSRFVAGAASDSEDYDNLVDSLINLIVSNLDDIDFDKFFAPTQNASSAINLSIQY